MAVFYILMLFPIIIQHVKIKGYPISYEKKNNRAMTFFFAFLTILAMLRHESVGNDTRNYINHFNRFMNSTWSEINGYSVERGYAYFAKVLTMISDNPQVFLAGSALVVSAMIYPTYKRLCVDTSLTIVLFGIMSTFVMMFSGIRQMLAIGIGFIAYDFTRRKKLLSFIITVGIALAFHTSAFMLAFMYPLYHAKITKKWLFIVIPVMAVMFMFNSQIFSVLGILLERYTKYDTSIVETGAYTMLILFAAFTAFSFVIPDETRLDDEIIGLRNFLLLSLVIQLFAPLHTIAMRMNYYYIIFIPLLLPKIIAQRSKRWNQVAVLGRHVMVAFFLAYFFMNAYSGSNLHVFPYHFFWESVG